MKSTKIYIAALISLSFVIACSNNKEEASHEMEMKEDKAMSEHSTSETASPLVREGVIDVESIDANNDGKIYECPMDWNVLADEYHDCPVCGMKMKEYSLADIKVNLDKYGYEYKK